MGHSELTKLHGRESIHGASLSISSLRTHDRFNETFRASSDFPGHRRFDDILTTGDSQPGWGAQSTLRRRRRLHAHRVCQSQSVHVLRMVQGRKEEGVGQWDLTPSRCQRPPPPQWQSPSPAILPPPCPRVGTSPLASSPVPHPWLGPGSRWILLHLGK